MTDIEEMIKILKELGISMQVFGCGCCDSPDVSFSYKGKQILKDKGRCNFSTEDVKETVPSREYSR
jgi:hypothetical protein